MGVFSGLFSQLVEGTVALFRSLVSAPFGFDLPPRDLEDVPDGHADPDVDHGWLLHLFGFELIQLVFMVFGSQNLRWTRHE
jgi:hypothetical protein